MRASARATVLVGAAAALAAAAPAPAATVKVEQLVVQRSGKARQAKVAARKTRVHVHGEDCAVPSATALAALALSDPPGLKLHDYGACSGRARDAGGLFVRSLGGDANKGTDGWVYKVGRRLATAGAADPSGPFGNGRLDDGVRVTWFYCHLDPQKHSCQRTLAVGAQQRSAGQLTVHVTAYDDRGKGRPSRNATVHAGGEKAKTDENGDAELAVPAGHHRVYATKHGAIRSFTEEVDAS
ncbi:MAG TPA: hypothetical protein VJT75_04000 [Thermoleophilaceae bacterium]|nr:hypothetical protein [Thermoleophilaceae bacterium]